MNLREVFKKVAHKRLVAVDLPAFGSNQHELNGSGALRSFFGTSETKGILSWYYFAEGKEPKSEDGKFTFYDARAKSNSRTGRSEWRFYYYGDFLARADVGDWFFLVEANNGRLLALIFAADSNWLRAAKLMFGVEDSSFSFDEVENQKLESQSLALLRRQILNELGLGLALPTAASDEEIIVSQFGRQFPTSKEMSAFARTQIEVDPNDPDEAVVRWLEREEELFLALEKTLILDRLNKGFKEVDEFMKFSLSVHNRRKSRMGLALQNQLEAIFDFHEIRYTSQCTTEGKQKPDFIFPGQSEYHDLNFDVSLLSMLAAKATCKDRWRQILVEANRISKKHLCTLEPAISESQTTEMAEAGITLVVPEAIAASYKDNPPRNLLMLAEFILVVKRKQTLS